jgi:hypothetical protein
VLAPLGIGALAAECERRDHGGKNRWFFFMLGLPAAASRDSRLILWIALTTMSPKYSYETCRRAALGEAFLPERAELN